MVGYAESKKSSGIDSNSNSESYKELLESPQNHYKEMNLCGIERFKLQSKILSFDSDLSKLPY